MNSNKLKYVYLVCRHTYDFNDEGAYNIRCGDPVRCFSSLEEANEFKKSYDIQCLKKSLFKDEDFFELFLCNGEINQDKIKTLSWIDRDNGDVYNCWLNPKNFNQLTESDINILLSFAKFSFVKKVEFHSEVFHQT